MPDADEAAQGRIRCASPPKRSLSGRTLLRLSLLHHRNVVRQRMLRYKQFVITGLLLFLPGMAAFKHIVVTPLARLFTEPGTPAAACGAASFVAITALWASIQRDAIDFPPAASFLASLPFSKRQILRRDIVVVALASSPWLLLLLVAFGAAFPDTGPDHGIPALLGMIFASLACQLTAARGLLLRSLATIAAAAAIGSSDRAESIALAILVSGLALRKLPLYAPWRASAYRPSRDTPEIRPPSAIHWITIHWLSLSRSRYGAYRLGAFASLVLAIVVALALHSGHASVTRIGGLLVTYGTLVTGLYGLGFATLLNDQSAYRGFLDALPAGRLRRALDMIIAVEVPVVALVLLLGASTVSLNSGATPTLVALCATLALCIAQYLIHAHLPRHAIAAGLSTAILVLAASLLALSGLENQG